jgi:D-xylose transport system permease protein
MSITPTRESAPTAGHDEPTTPRAPRAWMTAIAEGNLGSLRVLVVLAFIWTYFELNNSAFLSANNLTNLALQVAAVGVVSIGVVLVLLLGEIDISVGSVSGLCAAVVGVLSAQHGWSATPAILVGLGIGALVGLAQGTIVTWLAIPSFVVTLAGLLGWAGLQLRVVGAAGTISITDNNILRLANAFVPAGVTWTLVLIAVVALCGSAVWTRQRRRSEGLVAASLFATLLRPVLFSVVTVVVVIVMSQDRGVPLAVCILVALVIIFDALITQTKYGRHVMAVGGNEEAARRVGIPVRRVKVLIFVLGSTLAAAGGVMAMARLLSVDQSQGGGNFLLYAIAGPVIAGVSLFGGRGSIWGALLGAVVIGSIQNGMNLLSYQASTQAMVTAAVLLVAVILDALSRKQRRAHGRA